MRTEMMMTGRDVWFFAGAVTLLLIMSWIVFCVVFRRNHKIGHDLIRKNILYLGQWLYLFGVVLTKNGAASGIWN
jgi:hypothetical protein